MKIYTTVKKEEIITEKEVIEVIIKYDLQLVRDGLGKICECKDCELPIMYFIKMKIKNTDDFVTTVCRYHKNQLGLRVVDTITPFKGV